jgi:hypothetical protein
MGLDYLILCGDTLSELVKILYRIEDYKKYMF